MTSRIAALALAAGAFLLAGAWQLQATAAADLAEARRLQADEGGGDGAAPPSARANRAIIASLEQATRIRRDIEADLVVIERAVDTLGARQAAAGETTSAAHRELNLIARALGASVTSSGASQASLNELTGRLRRSVRLTEQIAEELEELDRKMGPTAGRPR